MEPWRVRPRGGHEGGPLGWEHPSPPCSLPPLMRGCSLPSLLAGDKAATRGGDGRAERARRERGWVPDVPPNRHHNGRPGDLPISGARPLRLGIK